VRPLGYGVERIKRKPEEVAVTLGGCNVGEHLGNI
jgi:hypothetical protein